MILRIKEFSAALLIATLLFQWVPAEFILSLHEHEHTIDRTDWSQGDMRFENEHHHCESAHPSILPAEPSQELQLIVELNETDRILLSQPERIPLKIFGFKTARGPPHLI